MERSSENKTPDCTISDRRRRTMNVQTHMVSRKYATSITTETKTIESLGSVTIGDRGIRPVNQASSYAKKVSLKVTPVTPGAGLK